MALLPNKERSSVLKKLTAYSVSLHGGALMFFAASSLQPLRFGFLIGSSFFFGVYSVSVIIDY